MAAKKYFHDRLILLLLSVNIFLALLTIVLVLLRLDFASSGQIIQYRSNLGLNAFKTGSVIGIMSFMVFSTFVAAFHSYLSYRAYHIRRHFALVVLGLGTLLLILSLIVSNALLIV
ncbi:MAG: hypothetical protein U5K77_01170 [Candidatus Saccharibacteria bacterium]|nr:hypothetical protein [Candidatus Saccharibacteria bacterium]